MGSNPVHWHEHDGTGPARAGHRRSLTRCFWPLALTAAAAAGCERPLAPSFGGDEASALAFFPQELADPIKVIRQTQDDVVATMTAGAPILDPVTVAAAPYTRLRLKGFASAVGTGAPEVPYVDVIVAVPRGATLRYEILERDEDAALALEHPLAFNWRLPVHNGLETFAQADPAAYQRAHGESPVEILDLSYAAQDRLATIRFNPAHYDPLARRLTVRRHLKVHFWFEAGLSLADADLEPPVGGDEPGVFANLALNAETAGPRFGPESHAARLDLVIIHESLRGAAARYLDFKRQRGRQVKDVYVTGKSSQEVKALISQEYRSATPPATTLLIGNISQIPAWRGSGDNSWTDFPYQTLDGGGKPDVALGRVPAHNAAELDNWIDKAMARETAPRNVNDVLLTAGKDVNLGCPSNVAAVGEKIRGGAPAVNLIRKFKSEGASQADVLGGYNANPNLIVYDGHGYQQGMSEIPLLINDLGRLSNTVPSIILDIACLNANWSGGAQARNFAESILLHKGAGAAGIMASGGSGYGHDYFRTIGGIMAQARGGGDSRMNEIGQVILSAKVQHGDQDRSYWNYYGDPASSVWEPAGGPGGGTVVPTQPVAAGIYAALTEGDSQAVLHGATAGQASEMGYCLGDRAVCNGSQAGGWLPMTMVRDSGGTRVFGARSSLSLSAGMQVTLRARLADGRELLQVIRLNSR